jgi:hypothetical protein
MCCQLSQQRLLRELGRVVSGVLPKQSMSKVQGHTLWLWIQCAATSHQPLILEIEVSSEILHTVLSQNCLLQKISLHTVVTGFPACCKFCCYVYEMKIIVAAQSKAWTVFARLNAGTVGSNPTQGIECLCAFVVLCVGSGLATGSSPVQGVLPTVYKIKKLKKLLRSNKRTVDRWRKLREI